MASSLENVTAALIYDLEKVAFYMARRDDEVGDDADKAADWYAGLAYQHAREAFRYADEWVESFQPEPTRRLWIDVYADAERAKKAAEIIGRAHAALGPDLGGSYYDLLCDQTEWTSAEIKAALEDLERGEVD